ncbi:hypothetical protein Mgra_00005245 [Meloidogyne graminicola]|uniref:Uncharacterized protein n=1 Tax=Meloidogyne graminicola TaxID=189291 RepID=A0A8S9ZQD8_9BILA|nr:hypothetical protein Mgra_00005245 [Meloidogyne graminicola]
MNLLVWKNCCILNVKNLSSRRSWRPLRRYNCLVDRDGQEVNIKTRLSPYSLIINYIVDYYKVDESMLKFKQKGLKFSNFVDRFWIRYFRFKRSFLDRAFWIGDLMLIIK